MTRTETQRAGRAQMLQEVTERDQPQQSGIICTRNAVALAVKTRWQALLTVNKHGCRLGNLYQYC